MVVLVEVEVEEVWVKVGGGDVAGGGRGGGGSG